MSENHSRTSVPTAEEAKEFVIVRTFDAPRDLVFRAWTETEHLTRWWGPKGMTVTDLTNDLRPGGMMHYALRMPGGGVMWGRWIYREIVPPERLSFVTSFSDPQGAVTRAPFFSGGWPLEVLSTVTFEEHEGRTTVTMRAVAINALPSEQKTFEGNFDSMTMGWGGSLDQLAAHLEAAKGKG
jgi:uncharacterized protein YndB with AHSA1/START domain